MHAIIEFEVGNLCMFVNWINSTKKNEDTHLYYSKTRIR